jgi:transcriptional regulator with XRE-family HTH domain
MIKDKTEIPEFADRLVKLRKLKGLTQNELAKKIGTTQRMISHYESKVKSPPIKVVIAIAEALEISIDMLLGTKPIKEDFNKKITKKIKLIESLSLRDQNAIWSFVNALVAKKELKNKEEDVKQ